jgi:hypothetical protein
VSYLSDAPLSVKCHGRPDAPWRHSSVVVVPAPLLHDGRLSIHERVVDDYEGITPYRGGRTDTARYRSLSL